MQIEYEISEQDFLKAQKLALRNLPNRVGRLIFRILPFWGLFLFIAVIWNVFQAGLAWSNGMIAPLFLGLLFLASPLLFNQAQRKMYRRNSMLHGKRLLVVDESGLNSSSSTFSAQLKWESFVKFVEDNNTFVLYVNQYAFHLLPKRMLSEQEISALREMFTQKITARSRAAV